eukprot:SAG31_NODE_5103_length_2742_cov_5.165721_2_plen_295_part_00
MKPLTGMDRHERQNGSDEAGTNSAKFSTVASLGESGIHRELDDPGSQWHPHNDQYVQGGGRRAVPGDDGSGNETSADKLRHRSGVDRNGADSSSPRSGLVAEELPAALARGGQLLSDRTDGAGSARAAYGFVFWVVTLFAYCFYLLWAFLPERVLVRFHHYARKNIVDPSVGRFCVAALKYCRCHAPHQHHIGVTVYPSKYWAIGIPCWICVAYGMSEIWWLSYNMMMNPSITSIHSYRDKYTTVRKESERDRREEEAATLAGALPQVYDLSIEEVNRTWLQMTADEEESRNKS